VGFLYQHSFRIILKNILFVVYLYLGFGMSATNNYVLLLERIQQNFSAHCFNDVFVQFDYSYSLVLDKLKLHIFLRRRHRLNALALPYPSLCGSKFCPSVLDTVPLRVPSRYIRDSSMFNVCPYSENCSSAMCASAANVVCRDMMCLKQKLSLKHIVTGRCHSADSWLPTLYPR
jgi:hypothetical protein